jgi:hypothetical protein
VVRGASRKMKKTTQQRDGERKKKKEDEGVALKLEGKRKDVRVFFLCFYYSANNNKLKIIYIINKF